MGSGFRRAFFPTPTVSREGIEQGYRRCLDNRYVGGHFRVTRQSRPQDQRRHGKCIGRKGDREHPARIEKGANAVQRGRPSFSKMNRGRMRMQFAGAIEFRRIS